MNANRQTHWDTVYSEKCELQTSWYCPHLDQSLRLIDALNVPRDQPVIDVGGGRATLVDDLLVRHFSDVSVLDLSAIALQETQQRLGVRGKSVHWMIGDITEARLPAEHYMLWHDRAVFHFLTDANDQSRYLYTMTHAVQESGYALIGTFAADGPEQCSGLSVRRYEVTSLAKKFAPAFKLITHCRDVHRTPSGNEQAFTYVVLQRNSVGH